MQSETLKPCPYCGGLARVNYENAPGSGPRVVVVCSVCDARSKALPVEDSHIDATTEEENRAAQRLAAIVAWNLRAPATRGNEAPALEKTAGADPDDWARNLPLWAIDALDRQKEGIE